jgi:hypothetical protein
MILCEDSQHEAFIRRFLVGMGWTTRDFFVKKSPAAAGSAEQWLRKCLPAELRVQRSPLVRSALMTVVDADVLTVSERLHQFEQECHNAQVPFRTADEAVAFWVPRRNIETWIRYLSGQDFDETTRYPKLTKARNCADSVRVLVRRCTAHYQDDAAPPSLVDACREYHERLHNR